MKQFQIDIGFNHKTISFSLYLFYLLKKYNFKVKKSKNEKKREVLNLFGDEEKTLDFCRELFVFYNFFSINEIKVRD